MSTPDAIRIGTASWTDPEFIKAGWYPDDVKNDAEGRLRYYASQFPMVEVNATFYALPLLLKQQLQNLKLSFRYCKSLST